MLRNILLNLQNTVVQKADNDDTGKQAAKAHVNDLVPQIEVIHDTAAMTTACTIYRYSQYHKRIQEACNAQLSPGSQKTGCAEKWKYMKSLDETRKSLDVVDNQIKALFTERLELTKDVIAYKMQTGKAVLDPAREQQKLDTQTADVENPFTRQGVRELFTQIMAIGKKLQYQILCENGKGGEIPFTPIEQLQTKGARVVYQGVEGAYGNAAMIQFFGRDVDGNSVSTFAAALVEVAEG